MTLLAGIVSRQGAAIPDTAAAALRQHLSRHPRDEIQTFRYPYAFLLKADIGAFGEPAAHQDPGGGVSLLAGEPLLDLGDPATRRSRTDDLALLHRAWATGDWTMLGASRGTFCAAHYAPALRQLTLVADKLGIRPLYYWMDDSFAVFATALRILEHVSIVPRTLDLRGVTEALTLGTPFGSRTRYAGVRVVPPGGLFGGGPAPAALLRYWELEAERATDRSENEQMRFAWELFSAAVSCRLGNDTAAVASLSGGLDSRCVVAALRARSVRVRTLNFGVPGTQDQALGAAFARAVGADHEEQPMQLDRKISFPALTAALWRLVNQRRPLEAERPRMLWSGDGGSLAMGYIYQTREMVDALRAGDPETAIQLFLQHRGSVLSTRFIQPHLAAALSSVPADGMRTELSRVCHSDPGRELHAVLLLNDQARHLAGHFEDIDVNRLELVTPFHDAKLQEALMQVPIDSALYHRFYTRWLRFFRPVATSVPWQTYPGHEPCPLPMPAGLKRQWDVFRHRRFRRERRRGIVEEGKALVKAMDFPDEILRRKIVRAATWLEWLGIGDYGYIVRLAAGLHAEWQTSDGSWDLSMPAPPFRGAPLTRVPVPA